MNLKEVKQYVEGLMKDYFKPKVLKKFDEDTNGNLTFDGDLISAKISGKSTNAIEAITDAATPSNDGLYVEDLNPKIQEVDVKTDKINIAQKTVNKVGTFPLLDDPIKFYGDNQTTPSTTDLDETVTLRDKVTNYDQLEIIMKPSNPVNTHPQRTLVNTKDIVFNPKEYNIKDGSIINIRYGADTTTDVNTNLYDSYITAWMKNDRTMYFRELVNGLSKNAFDDPKSPMVKLKDFTSNNSTGIVLKTDNFKEGTSSVYFPHAGANQIAITRPELVFSGDFTAQCWVYAYNDSDPYSIIFGDANNSQFMFFIRDVAAGDNMTLLMGTTRLLNTNKKATYNQWMHYVAERYNGVLSLYENGHIIGQVNYTGTCNMSNFAMGQNASAGNTKFHGYIDSLYVFDEAKYKSTDFDVNTDIKTDNPVFGCLFEPETALENSQEWTITEINGINKESVIIDPMNYIDTKQGIQDTPVGHIMSIMGNNAPEHYLKCDGTIYNKDDYPHLWEYFKKEFGTPNKFGGDGTTTFAVPDLRGEFLRGSNLGDATKVGASVGTHQEPTIEPNEFINIRSNWLCKYYDKTGSNVSVINPDKTYPEGIAQSDIGAFYVLNDIVYSPSVSSTQHSTRPTNTSVLWVIKYEPTYFVGSINGKEDVVELLDGTLEGDFTHGSRHSFDLTKTKSLKQSIQDFDYIDVETRIYYEHDATSKGFYGNQITRVPVKDIILYQSGSLSWLNTWQVTSMDMHLFGMLFGFKDNNTIYIYRVSSSPNTNSGNEVDYKYYQICSVKGIRTNYSVSNKTV